MSELDDLIRMIGEGERPINIYDLYECMVEIGYEINELKEEIGNLKKMKWVSMEINEEIQDFKEEIYELKEEKNELKEEIRILKFKTAGIKERGQILRGDNKK